MQLGLWVVRVGMVCVGLLSVAMFVAWSMMTRMPGKSYAGALPPLTDHEAILAAALEQDVEVLAGEIGERNSRRYAQLRQAADFLAASLATAGYQVRRQEYEVDGQVYDNVEVEITGTQRPEEICVIGGHYDAAVGTPAANDNATGAAAVLALARAFLGQQVERTLRFVCFGNEENPFGKTPPQGSVVYANRCRDRNEDVVAMLSLETLGYYADEAGSQQYPWPFSLFYPSTGDFVAFVGNTLSRRLVREAIASFRSHTQFPSEGASPPGVIPGIGWSGRRSFWHAGYSGVMVTDTAPFRYPYYHKPDDTPDKIDYDRLARVVAGLERVVANLAGAPKGHEQQTGLVTLRDLPVRSFRQMDSASKLRIAPEEYWDRLERLKADIRDAGLDLFIVSAFDSIYYLIGAGFMPLERPFFLLVSPDGSPVLLVPKLEHEHMMKAHNVSAENIHTYWDYPAPSGRNWPDRLHDLIGGAQQIGVEPALRQEIAQQLEAYTIRMEPLVERLWLVKSPAEIEMIRRAAGYADFGVERLMTASYFGASVAEGFAETRTVTTRILREVDECDLSTTEVLMATWPAPHSAKPHSIPDLNDRLREGPHVALVLTRVNGYAAESERTYFTAPPSQEARKAFDAMMAARRIAFDMIRPGVACSDIDVRVSRFLEEEGYGREDQRLHRTGHGFGLGSHEAPWIAEGSDDRLAEGMVLSVEPGIYLSGIGGFRRSDTVLVTKDGYEVLTQVPTDLLVMRSWKPFTRIKGWFVRSALRLSDKAERVEHGR